MAEVLQGHRVASGTWGEVWFDNEKLAEVYKFQSKATYTKEEITRCGIMTSDHKITKISLAGSVGMHKVNSRLAKVVGEQVMQGHDPRISIIGKLDDPDTNGADYILHEGVSFDDLTLMDWEAGVAGKIEAPFTFASYTYLESMGD